MIIICDNHNIFDILKSVLICDNLWTTKKTLWTTKNCDNLWTKRKSVEGMLKANGGYVKSLGFDEKS